MGRGRKRPPGTPGGGGSGSGPRRFTEAEQRAFLEELEGSGESVQTFARRIGVTVWTVYWWRKAARRLSAAKARAGSGSAALEARPGKQAKRPAAGERRVPSYGPDARREAVEAYRKSGLSQQDFGKLWGVSAASIGKWSRAYETGGPKALEEKARGRPKGSGGMFPRLPQAVREAIVATKRRFPTFGLRKVRDFLLRFQGIRVSAGGVRSTLVAASGAASGEGGDPLVGPSKPSRPVRKRKPMVRRFERARAGQLWQTDITSFVLARHHVRVYLVAFIDDHSRYVVSFGLHTHQKNEMVQEALLEGIEKFGKPEEVLSDQGPQYFSWRGKSSFRRLLDRKGIKHVVARSHHPMTVGKCERFWETVKVEFWERCQPQDLSEARERIGHFIAHFNHFRPHQGIGGLVPADRFFGASAPLRRTIEAALTKHELALALDEQPRTPVYLFGQIGDQQVSLHGEKGKLVIQTPEGVRKEMALSELGVSAGRGCVQEPKEKTIHGNEGNEQPRSGGVEPGDAGKAGGASDLRGGAADEDGGADGGALLDGPRGGCGDARRLPGGSAEPQADATVPEAHEVPACAEGALAGPVPLGGCDGGGAAAGPCDVHGDARALAREGDEAGDLGAPAAPAAPALADVSAGACRYGSRPSQAAAEATERRTERRTEHAGPGLEEAQAGERGPEPSERAAGRPDRDPSRPAGESGECRRSGGSAHVGRKADDGDEPAPGGENPPDEEGGRRPSAGPSGASSEARGADGRGVISAASPGSSA